ncbi:MAG: DNA polymerase III subunit beta [Acidobacteriota bacterium]
MELTVKASDLQREVQLVYGVIERKATIPILSNILLKAIKGEIQLTATDIEVTIKSSCPATVSSEGAVTLLGQKIYESIRFLPPDAEINMKLKENNWMIIHCERTKYRIAGIASDEFPIIQECDYSQAVTLQWAPVKHMINKVIFAITAEDTRYALRGALMELDENGITFVATDGHRLAYIHKNEKTGLKSGKIYRSIIPRKALHELLKVDDENQILFYSESENHLFFKVGNREIIANAVEGEFPDYMKILADREDRKIRIVTQEFMDALKRVSPFSSEKMKGVTLSMEEGKMEILASSADQGEAEETIQAEYSGKQMKINFNARYLAEFLTAVGSEQIVMNLKDESSHGMFKPENGEEFQYKYVVMPMST